MTTKTIAWDAAAYLETPQDVAELGKGIVPLDSMIRLRAAVL